MILLWTCWIRYWNLFSIDRLTTACTLAYWLGFSGLFFLMFINVIWIRIILFLSLIETELVGSKMEFCSEECCGKFVFIFDSISFIFDFSSSKRIINRTWRYRIRQLGLFLFSLDCFRVIILVLIINLLTTNLREWLFLAFISSAAAEHAYFELNKRYTQKN